MSATLLCTFIILLTMAQVLNRSFEAGVNWPFHLFHHGILMTCVTRGAFLSADYNILFFPCYS